MQRRKFMVLSGTAVGIAGVTCYLLSDTKNFVRSESIEQPVDNIPLKDHEREILYLASLAPSGHNTQPWLVKYKEPWHWIISNDKTRWLNAVDPTQRETILSIGAFLYNLEYAARYYGYNCDFTLLALSNQDEDIVEVRLNRVSASVRNDIEQMKLRRTIRSGYHIDLLNKEDLDHLVNTDPSFIHYFPNSSKEGRWLNEQTIEANRMQCYRDNAQRELADWIRFSSRDAREHLDGLTLAGMEIEGISAWVLRNFYGKADVMKYKFREQSIAKVVKQVRTSAGWIIITSNDNTVASILETGKRMQQLFLKVRSRNIAIHPMTQLLEEPATNAEVNKSLGISDPIQFVLRTGYVTDYSAPVTLRRSVNLFVKT